MFLFSGQGSQYYQMGRQLHEQNPTFRSTIEAMDRQVQALLGHSVLKALYGEHSKADPFDDIRQTHPAIYMVECALAKTLMQIGITPDATLGASLGTVAALVMADRMSADEGLTLVARQALAIHAHCPPGGMVAVLSEPGLYDHSDFLQARSVMVGQNFASHFVLAAPQDNLTAVKRYLERAGITFQVLPVRYAFHAPWIDPVRQQLIDACGTPSIREAGLPMMCCARGDFLQAADADYFWQVARREIAFMRAVTQAEQAGPWDYIDLGPSGTLSTFLKYLLPASSASRVFTVMTPYGRDLNALAALQTQWTAGGVSAVVEG